MSTPLRGVLRFAATRTMKYLAGLRSALPDSGCTPEDLVAQGDKIAIRYAMYGAHGGALGDIAPTGKQIALRVIRIFPIGDRKVVEEWMESDSMIMMQQLGVIPPMQ